MNKNIIKILTMLLAAIMVLSLISCSGKDDDEDELIGLSTPVPIPEELIGSVIFSSYRCDDGEIASFNYMQSFFSR